jgi:hypothetical protein
MVSKEYFETSEEIALDILFMDSSEVSMILICIIFNYLKLIDNLKFICFVLK